MTIRRSAAAMALAAAFALAPVPLYAQSAAETAILKELQAIRALLQQLVIQTVPAPGGTPAPQPPSPPLPTTATLDDVQGYFLGRLDAPVTMVEFTDLQCPYCKLFHEGLFDRLKKEYIDTGKVRFVTRDLPLSFHHYAMPAAMASRCAGEQGKFWEVRRALQLNADKLDRAFIVKTAQDAGVAMPAFNECMESNRFEAAIKKDLDAAQRARFTGTPAFVIGRSGGQGLTGDVILGALNWPVFDAKLQEWLQAR